MADASYVQPSFLGGELSQFAQGRFDRQDYRTCLNVCFNGFPVEIGTWVRRPGSQYAGHTRGGAQGRVVKFDFEQANAITLEFTDGFLRFRAGTTLVTTNDAQAVIGISAANPAVVNVASAWPTGSTVILGNLGASVPLLQNRQLIITNVDGTHFSLQDALTGTNIDGSTLGAVAAGATISRVQELATVYTGGAWSNIRPVQAETTDILLNGAVAPQALTVTRLPTPGVNAQFAIAPAIFNDGPYLDSFTNGVEATPSAKSGIISITLAFPAYSATTAYAVGAFVTSSSVNYVSLLDQNVGNTPVSSPAFWAATTAGAAINNGRGFLGTDIGRLVRLFSEPPLWVAASTYVAGTVVAYNPSGQPGASTYWQSLTSSNTGNAPGADLTNWQLVPQGAAIWTWGKITGLSNVIDRQLAGSTSIGDMVNGGGLAAAFDGVFVQSATSCAEKTITLGFVFPGQVITLTGYVGKNYSAASDQRIGQATVYPSSDRGFAAWGITTSSITFNLRGKSSVPASSSDGTLLGTLVLTVDQTSAATIVSTDQATAWKYVWVEQIITATIPSGGHGGGSFSISNAIAELSLFNPAGTGTGAGYSVEILGPPLLYTNPIVTWRLGVYSNTTGWPTCGTYHEGRLWLGGAVANRFDASVANGIVGGTVNFAPTDQYGVVAPNAAISYTLNSDSVNPIFWMQPDLQGIIMGTQAGEWLIQAPTTGPIAPANIAGRRVTKIGCANVEPRRTEHTNVFVQRYGQKLMEYFADVYSGKFSAPNIADKAQHITRAGIAELAYMQAVTPIIWGRDGNGALFGVTYKRDTLTTAQGPTFNGWHRHALGSGRAVESLCSGPSAGGNLDSLTMVTNDATTNIRHVEILTDTLDEKAPLGLAWFVDDAVVPSSTTSINTPSAGAPYGGLTLNGLWHLNGKTVSVFAGGLDCGDPGEGKPPVDFLVTNGSVFVPYGDSVSAGSGAGQFNAAFAASGIQIVVGFTYTSQGQLVRPSSPAESGSRNGPAFAKTRRSQRYGMLLVNSAGLSIGTSFAKLDPVILKDAGGVRLPVGQTFSGIYREFLTDDYSFDSMFCWQSTRPLPANIVAAGAFDHTQDV